MRPLPHVALLALAVSAACRSGASGEEPSSEPLVQGFYRVERLESADGSQSMDDVFSASIENRAPDAPEFLLNRLSIEFDGNRITAGADQLLATDGKRFPYGTCSVRLTAEVIWRGDMMEIPATVRASDVVRVFDHPEESDDFIEVTCSVHWDESVFRVESEGDVVKLQHPTGTLVLVPDDHDPKFASHIR